MLLWFSTLTDLLVADVLLRELMPPPAIKDSGTACYHRDQTGQA